MVAPGYQYMRERRRIDVALLQGLPSMSDGRTCLRRVHGLHSRKPGGVSRNTGWVPLRTNLSLQMSPLKLQSPEPPCGHGPVWLRFVKASVRIVGPAVVAGILAQCIRLPPVSDAIGWVAVRLGQLLPRGSTIHLSDPTDQVSGPLSAHWGFWYYWLAQPPTFLVYIGAFLLARVALCAISANAVSPRPRHACVRFLGSFPEFCATLTWTLAAACLWRFYWGLSSDLMRMGLQTVPVALGPGSYGLVWFGAAIGYFWSVRQVLARQALQSSTDAPVCASCGYPLGPTANCPECGQDRSLAISRSLWSKVQRVTWAYGPLVTAIGLLGWPYVLQLFMLMLPDDWIRFMTLRVLPGWW